MNGLCYKYQMLISILYRAPLCSGSFWASSSQSSPAPLYPSLRLWLTGEVMNIFVFVFVFVLLLCLCLTHPILGVQALVNRKMSKTFFIFPCVFFFLCFSQGGSQILCLGTPFNLQLFLTKQKTDICWYTTTLNGFFIPFLVLLLALLDPF